MIVSWRLGIGWILVFGCWAGVASAQVDDAGLPSLPVTIDRYLDRRWDGTAEETAELVARLQAEGVDAEGLEKLVRAGRASYPTPSVPVGEVVEQDLDCDHVDYRAHYFLRIPTHYSAETAHPLLLIGHGGNGAMTLDYARRASRAGFTPWLELAEKHGFILAAPLTERGWGAIGNSIVLSLISKLTRELHIDPDRIYLSGHSMGGHLSWRSGISFADRWGAIAPMSGGYDYVENELVYRLYNVPGYATWGQKEPYDIAKFNRKIRDWMKAHGYRWINREKPGGHQIFPDELPSVAKFLLAHPRDLYRSTVYARGGGAMVQNSAGSNPKWEQEHHWRAGRPISVESTHWLRLTPRETVAGEEALEQVVWAEIHPGGKRLEITSQNVRRLTIGLHPELVAFRTPLTIEVNGQRVWREKPTADLAAMLEHVREFDDRGRIFHAFVTLDIETDREVPAPRGR